MPPQNDPQTTEARRPTAGAVEDRTVPDTLSVDGRRLRGRIPYGVESRDLGNWREVIEPGALANTRFDNLIATVNHVGMPLGRYPGTIDLEDRTDGLHWSVDPPASRADVREAVERGDLREGSWRMVVGRDEWRGDVRHVHEIEELRDVCVAIDPAAYPQTAVEMRTQPDAPDRPDSRAADVPEDAPTPSPGLRVEDRNQTVEDRDAPGLMVEDRTASDGVSIEQRIEDALHTVRKGESRALTTAISISPGELSTTLFDRLRAASVVLGTGIRTLTTDKDSVTYPSLTADVVADAFAEAAPITATDPTLGTVIATPRKLAALVQTSNEALDDSDPSLATVLNDHLLQVLALKLDQQLLEGTGTPPQVRGIKNISGITTTVLATNGIQPTLDHIADAIAVLEANNVPLARMRLVVAPRNLATFRKLKASTGGTYLWDADPASASPASIFGVPVVASAQLTLTETTGTSSLTNSMYLYDTESLVYVQRSPIEIELDRSRLFNSDQSEFRAKSRGDLISPTPTGIVRMQGALV
jgi:HK97 family phage major capsid protein